MPKAIKISKANKNELIAKFNLYDDELDGVEGHYLVAEFGSQKPEGYLSEKRLDELYVRGTELSHDFFVVTRRV